LRPRHDEANRVLEDVGEEDAHEDDEERVPDRNEGGEEADCRDQQEDGADGQQELDATRAQGLHAAEL
jgi:hypothetical protein